MSNRYGLRFGSGDPSNYTGLSPTFSTFLTEGGTAMVSPPITEVGSGTGLYQFTFDPGATYTVFFVADGGVSITDPSSRYVVGNLDPISTVDQKVGFPQDSYGTTTAPDSIYGYVKRNDELWKSDATFNKSTGNWQVYATGTSTLLFSKILTNQPTLTTKT